MFSEAVHLNSSLERCGLKVSQWHRWLKVLRAGPAIVVGVAEDGSWRHVQYLSAEHVAELSKIEKSNHQSFPAFNLEGPLLTAPQEFAVVEQRDSKGVKPTGFAQAQRLAAVAQAATLAYEAKDGARLLARLKGFSEELLPIFAAFSPRFQAFPTLLKRVAHTKLTGGQLIAGFADAAIAELANGAWPDVDLLQLLLFGKRNKKGLIEEVKVTMILDIAEWDEAPVRVASPVMTGYWNKALLGVTSPITADVGLCSLSGQLAVLELDKLPNPKLPLLGNTILHSVNPDTPCLQRYGLTGPAAFPVSKDLATSLQSSLLWITEQPRLGKTWKPVPREDDAGSDLLLAYLPELPESEFEVAEVLSEIESAERAGYFEAAAGWIPRAISDLRDRGIRDDQNIHVTVLRRINKGQVQVEISSQYSVQRLRHALSEWEAGAANRPPFYLTLPRKKGETAIIAHAWPPFLAEIVRLTKLAWIRSGTESTSVPGISLSQVHELFLGDQSVARQVARSLLRLLVARTGPLLSRCGEALHRNSSLPSEFIPATRETILRTIATLGLCLHKLGIEKENYMREPAYLLGRMLSLVDTLHQEYCHAVRKGDTPPQLLGNSLMATAAESPNRCLAQLERRLVVYHGWATTRGTGLARWAQLQYGEIAPAVAEQIPERLDDAGRAQLLLGYVARYEKKSPAISTLPENNVTSETGEENHA